MKGFIWLIAVVMLISGSDDVLYAETAAPSAVVNKRMAALNNHALEDFLSTYAEDVSIYVYPRQPLGSGREHMRMLFAPFFEAGRIQVEVSHMTTADRYVVVESKTTFGDRAETGIAIYEVRDGLIQSVTFLRDSIRAKSSHTSDNE